MANTRLPGSIFFLLVVVAAAQGMHYFPLLPNVVASHFGGSGAPNGWQTKTVFFGFNAGVVFVAALVGFGAPRLIAVTPVSLINLPNKNYWLAPERRAETLAYLEAQFAWFGCALLLFLILVFEFVIRANLHPPVELPAGPFVGALIGFLLFTGFWTVRLVRRFASTR